MSGSIHRWLEYFQIIQNFDSWENFNVTRLQIIWMFIEHRVHICLVVNRTIWVELITNFFCLKLVFEASILIMLKMQTLRNVHRKFWKARVLLPIGLVLQCYNSFAKVWHKFKYVCAKLPKQKIGLRYIKNVFLFLRSKVKVAKKVHLRRLHSFVKE